ncbi:MAG: UDP-N-acetylmuramate dehydrogenase [Desulfobacterales bacterium]|nr:UDP-N-acetylmuramate dehydrogenase [Desulfobacterales bacterium]
MLEGIIRENVALAPQTTIGLGGRARYFAGCGSVEALRVCLTWAGEKGLPVQVLGGGSNIIFADDGFGGLVLKVDLPGMTFCEAGKWDRVTVGAGQNWDALVEACVGRGLAGVECLAGIPGQVGATPIQNVGAYGQEVAETIAQVRALDRQSLDEVVFDTAACGFGYRHSRFKGADRDRYIVTEVDFRLRRQGRPSLAYPELRRHVKARVDLDALESGSPVLGAVREAVLALRRSKSMVVDPVDPDSRSAGSFFLNPLLSRQGFAALERMVGDGAPVPTFAAAGGIKVPAAWLVEQAGFAKGFRRGGVGISSHHALALINRGGSAAELLSLAADIEHTVREKFGVDLEREPVVVQGLKRHSGSSAPWR